MAGFFYACHIFKHRLRGTHRICRENTPQNPCTPRTPCLKFSYSPTASALTHYFFIFAKRITLFPSSSSELTNA